MGKITDAVYDKFKVAYSKFLVQNKADVVEGEQKEEFTPMPQYKKKGDIMVKNVFDKVERSAVMMRRMEYTAKLKNIKMQKKKIAKAKIIQRKWRQFFKFSYLYKVVFIQPVY